MRVHATGSASEMTYTVSGGALNSTHLLRQPALIKLNYNIGLYTDYRRPVFEIKTRTNSILLHQTFTNCPKFIQ